MDDRSHSMRNRASPGDKAKHHASAARLLERLSRREREILGYVVEGHSNVAIGRTLDLSPKTIATYRSRMMHKLGVDHVPALVKFAILAGVTSLT